MLPGSASAPVAYQRVLLEEIRDLYSELNLDLNHYLNVELGVLKRLDSAEEEASEVRGIFSALGVGLGDTKPDEGSSDNASTQTPGGKEYQRIKLGNADDFESWSERPNPT